MPWHGNAYRTIRTTIRRVEEEHRGRSLSRAILAMEIVEDLQAAGALVGSNVVALPKPLTRWEHFKRALGFVPGHKLFGDRDAVESR